MKQLLRQLKLELVEERQNMQTGTEYGNGFKDGTLRTLRKTIATIEANCKIDFNGDVIEETKETTCDGSCMQVDIDNFYMITEASK